MYKLAADSNENAKQSKTCEDNTETCENSEKLSQSEAKVIETKVDIHVEHDNKVSPVVVNNDYCPIWPDGTPLPESPPPPLPPRTYKHKPLERTLAMPPITSIPLDALRQLKPKGLMNSSNLTSVSPTVESKEHRPLTRVSSQAGDHINMKCSVQNTLSNSSNKENTRFMMLTDENRKPRTESKKDELPLPPSINQCIKYFFLYFMFTIFIFIRLGIWKR